MLTDSPAPVPQPSHTSQGISLPALRCFAPQGMWPGDASSSGRRCEVGLGKKRAKRSEHLHGKSGGWRQPSSGFPEHEAALSWGQQRCSLSPALLLNFAGAALPPAATGTCPELHAAGRCSPLSLFLAPPKAGLPKCHWLGRNLEPVRKTLLPVTQQAAGEGRLVPGFAAAHRGTAHLGGAEWWSQRGSACPWGETRARELGWETGGSGESSGFSSSASQVALLSCF